jgi:hypothetical protein
MRKTGFIAIAKTIPGLRQPRLPHKSRFFHSRREMAVTINKKTMAMIILAAFIFLALASAAIPAEKIAFVRENNIWIANLDGGTQKQLTFSGKMKDPANFFPNLALSPDGQRIAYADMKDIYLLPTSGGESVNLIFGMKSADNPWFSSDGSKLLFLGTLKANARAAKNKASEKETSSISMVELDSGKVNNIVVTTYNPEMNHPYLLPALSPSGGSIAIQDGASDYSGGFGILNETGKVFFHFPPGAGDETPYWRPLFSADGKKILCFSPATNSKGSDIISLVDIDDGIKRKVAEGLWPTLSTTAGPSSRALERSFRREEQVLKIRSWPLELREGAQPKKIIANAASPAGQTIGQTIKKVEDSKPDSNTQVGPEAVWKLPDNFYASFAGCNEDLECLMTVMKKGGASPQAMAFTRMMKDNCYLEKFKEMGKVDLAYVFYPSRANTNWAYFLVNGSPAMISPRMTRR